MRYQSMCSLIAALSLATIANAQLLNGDSNFPLLNELRWEQTMGEVRSLCEQRHLAATVTDSAIVVELPVLGFASRTELQFDRSSKKLKLVQAKFNEPSKLLADSLTSHLTRMAKREPVRSAKEKSLLIITIRMEMAMWRLHTGMVNLVTAMRGDSLFDASLVLAPPTAQQSTGASK